MASWHNREESVASDSHTHNFLFPSCRPLLVTYGRGLGRISSWSSRSRTLRPAPSGGCRAAWCWCALRYDMIRHHNISTHLFYLFNNVHVSVHVSSPSSFQGEGQGRLQIRFHTSQNYCTTRISLANTPTLKLYKEQNMRLLHYHDGGFVWIRTGMEA